MKKIIKYMALFAIVATATKAFVDAFTPEYESWKEKFPPEPEIEDDEESGDVAANAVQASDLFKSESEDYLNKKGVD
ncbi:hypothetical protein [Dysgonomonas sp. GY617]|uniref:hypothetical protein n=1 Tax=Dysgonomonas sp. GY617 TaxID=2780420 RepID=UPI00188374E8|nr:hypothetical protein [Dysgonomonas sp. GY617]MBF0574413.1 hypothetical protein [Dysgonomonas sp. GY617]